MIPPASLPEPPRRARLAVALCFLGNALLFASWVSRIPAVQARLRLTPQELGLSLLGLALGATGALPVAGWLCTRVGSRAVTAVSAVAACALLPLAAVAPDRLSLVAVLFVFGAMQGAFDVAMNAQAVEVERRYGRPLMSSFHALWSVGGLAGAALGGGLALAGVSPLAHFAVLGGIIAAVLAAGALAQLLPLAPAAGPAERSSIFVALPRRLLALGAIAFCVMMGEGAIGDWSAIFLRDSARASEAFATSGYAAFCVAMAGGRFFGDALTARFGPVALLRVSGLLSAAGLTSALLIARPWPALAGFAAVGAGFALVVPLVFSASGRTRGLPPAAALAAATTMGYGGFLVGPPVIGFLAGAAGLRAAMGLIVVNCVLLFLLASHAREPEEAARFG